MADPPRRRDQRRSLAAHRIRDALALEPQEPDLHLAHHDAKLQQPRYRIYHIATHRSRDSQFQWAILGSNQ